ncbi:1-deoxy-D-xylulose-5-phosphate synthase [Nonomuraea jiangxiensis]|uniref:1-deoxy-D-xylulose-5-phosphate synthase n=1 Tax=Nonomuraea jiangxiensis TaxID=633440 RepID=A0A1G9T213_9ACTN|nr:1-deoxy-D-xylulose-5-phosphate synthase [Nonomuraea jiangxiensis]SDM41115.1 1-deoxy-D-xylulose-5-phosphate synthase [Nonomuraea jiangxiensis]
MKSLLPYVSTPEDLRALPAELLPGLAREIRDFLIDKVSANGGHLGSNLGIVELTIALHRVFDSPGDAIVFDTGHQAYVHKILTGRRGAFDELRRRGGLSGYPSRQESAHDHLDSSHASTALAYADGMAKARRLVGGDPRPVVAVVGDGALTGGVAWEALNNLGAAKHHEDNPVIVVLNDNGRSYAATFGACADHLERLRAAAADVTVFEQLGLRYLGPVDGHDIPALERALRAARELREPVVVHCVTVKGRGYEPAEQDLDEHLHAIPVTDPATGQPLKPAATTWTHVFSQHLCLLGERRPDLVAITAAMPGPTGLAAFGRRFPERMFDVGIAEQQAMASAAGMAMSGLHPVVAIYATFLNRAFDQVLMDIALHRLPVTLVLDRAGITGPDGPSHHGMWDLAALSVVPGMRVAAPRDAVRLRELLEEAVAHDGPTALRFPKAPAEAEIAATGRAGDVDVLSSTGQDVLLVAVGPMAEPCLGAAAMLSAAGLGVTVVDPRWVIPVSSDLRELARGSGLVVTVEDGLAASGAGALLRQVCPPGLRVLNLGLPCEFVPQGGRSELLAEAGLTGPGIAHAVREELRAWPL